MHASNPYANEVIRWQIYPDLAVVFFQFFYSSTFFVRDIGFSSSKIHVLFIKLAAVQNNIHPFKHSIHFIDSFHIIYCRFFFFYTNLLILPLWCVSVSNNTNVNHQSNIFIFVRKIIDSMKHFSEIVDNFTRFRSITMRMPCIFVNCSVMFTIFP